MSEEAVRQTRSQKRALGREISPHDSEAPPTQSDSKKLKLDGAETGDPDQDHESPNKPQPEPETTKDDEDLVKPLVKPVVQPEKAMEPELPRLTLPLVLPSHPAQEQEQEQDRAPKQSEQSLENRTEWNDRGDQVKVKSEMHLDGQNRTVLSEPKVASSMMTSTEVKATIKVEVQTGEQALDMSTSRGAIKREPRPPSPDDDDDDDDVIVLSDNDSCSPPMNGLNHFKELDTVLLMKSRPEERDRIIKQLKEELRLEEAKLVLLKKLRQSQTQKDALQKPSGLSGSAAPPSLIRGSIAASKGSQQVVSGRSSGTVIPPPLVRGGQQISSKHGSHNSQIIMPPLVRGAQQIQSLRQQQQQQLSGSGSGSSGPPPLLLAPRANVPGSQAQRGLMQSGLIRVGNVNNASLLVNISQASPTNMKGSSISSQSGNNSVSVVNVNDSPAARQAAAKLALRKQLEKTLLEIPPPKPPAPELNFLPSAANNEFIYLVGLEDVVQNLLDSMMRAKTGLPPVKPAIKEPFTCIQCSTDFTCRWRQDKAKGGTILCADCMSSNQKKALKAEHTNRLKAAFVKALQQEQEIEQRILQQAASPVSHTPSSSSSSSSSPSVKAEHLMSQQLKQVQAQARVSSLQHHHHHQQQNRGQSIARHHSNIKQSPQGQLSRSGIPSVGVRGVSHSFSSSSSQLQSAVAAAALVSRPGKHAHVRPAAQGSKGSSSGNSSRGSAQATAWRKQNINTGVTMAYVNPSLSVHKTSSTVDARQREYLLDMIPSRPISQTANTWK
ncbi:transcriptional repressor p66 alpha-like isoform X2 [Salvelinus namaycush]|uniref:Transcriptional repressor p66 alpha-like isoform X2 n=1 Tax=Salvelinus namaycush TaxID=8040 RepID=A0A8U1C105_SALNM|nr:transcriptional repressor p66 alpha-like isoform X2 [Salvelinus namaycush]